MDKLEDIEKQLNELSLDKDEYITHEFMGGTIRLRIVDGYFSATDICKVGGKLFGDWMRLDSTKEFLKILNSEINKDNKITLVQIKKGNSTKFKQGSWIHPMVVTHLAMWISPRFSVKISFWIEEWKAINNNKNIYNNELCILEPSITNKQEKELRIKLSKELNAEMEVETSAGFIDLLSESLIVEIKEFSLWKHALGQILSYSKYYPSKNKVIYLFGDVQDDKITMIEDIYSKYDIELILVN